MGGCVRGMEGVDGLNEPSIVGYSGESHYVLRDSGMADGRRCLRNWTVRGVVVEQLRWTGSVATFDGDDVVE